MNRPLVEAGSVATLDLFRAPLPTPAERRVLARRCAELRLARAIPPIEPAAKDPDPCIGSRWS